MRVQQSGGLLVLLRSNSPPNVENDKLTQETGETVKIDYSASAITKQKQKSNVLTFEVVRVYLRPKIERTKRLLL